MPRGVVDVTLLGDDDSLVEGNDAVVHAEWRVPDENGVLTNPTAVTFTAQRGGDAPSSYVYGIAPEVARLSTGIYELTLLPAAGVWRVEVDGTTAAQASGEIAFEIFESEAIALSGRALCTTADVERLVPGFTFDEATDRVLTDLINAESDAIHDRTGREFRPITAGSSTRLFDISRYAQRDRTIRVGDCNAIIVVTIQRLDGTVLEMIDAANRVSLPRVRKTWQPIRQIWFPGFDVAAFSTMFAAGRVVAVNATWGFPAVPDRIRVGCAKLALYRYMNDVPGARATALGEAAAELNLGGMFASANEAIMSLADPAFA